MDASCYRHRAGLMRQPERRIRAAEAERTGYPAA